MKKIICLALVLPLLVGAAELKHPVATVSIRGVWDKDSESEGDTLILDSKPTGQQIVVSLLRAQKEFAALDQIADAARKVFEVRLKSVKQLSPDMEFERPEVDTTDSTVVIVCRGSVPKAKIRVAIRVEGIAKHVRSTSVYDHTGLSSDDFRKWSAAIFAGIK